MDKKDRAERMETNRKVGKDENTNYDRAVESIHAPGRVDGVEVQGDIMNEIFKNGSDVTLSKEENNHIENADDGKNGYNNHDHNIVNRDDNDKDNVHENNDVKAMAGPGPSLNFQSQSQQNKEKNEEKNIGSNNEESKDKDKEDEDVDKDEEDVNMISLPTMHMVFFAGLRGAVAFACANIFPDTNGNRSVNGHT